MAVVAYGVFRGRPNPATTQAWLAILLFGAVDGMLFQGLLAAGLEKVPAGIGSVIIDSQPLTVALVASLLFGETLSSLGVLGLALGITGLLLLEVPISTLQGWFNLSLSGALLQLCSLPFVCLRSTCGRKHPLPAQI